MRTTLTWLLINILRARSKPRRAVEHVFTVIRGFQIMVPIAMILHPVVTRGHHAWPPSSACCQTVAFLNLTRAITAPGLHNYRRHFGAGRIIHNMLMVSVGTGHLKSERYRIVRSFHVELIRGFSNAERDVKTASSFTSVVYVASVAWNFSPRFSEAGSTHGARQAAAVQ